jgi:CRP-like cAMP-binding protein
LASTVSKKRFKRGEILVEQGKKSDALYIVLTGRTRVLMTDNKGREVILATLAAGDYVGEMSLIDDEPHSATVVADQQVDVLVLGRSSFLRCLGENMEMAHAVMRVLVQRLRKASENISSLALVGVYGRVAKVLLDSAAPDADGQLLIRDKVSRQDIAKMVGASREMVSRVMKDFEEQGFIQMLETGVVRVIERRSQPR